ncbi:hypothetical protein [Amycolatopsis sp. VC5-11]|uniref:hypothetical protein n=1 Tax=Amycolatopsis sp. VC5-11 TaxID=3120156 RepID=UPI00300A1A3A
MTSAEKVSLPLELPADVAERMAEELPLSAKIINCVRTAAALIEQAVVEDRGLRLAESAGYNLREAFEAVVAEQKPADGRGLHTILEVWGRYRDAPESERATALDALEQELRAVAEQRRQDSYHTARLVTFLRRRTGLDPLPDLDPTSDYEKLRGQANQGLHKDMNLAEVIELYDLSIAWFIRMFTPPDQIVRALRALAAEPWQGPSQLVRLRGLANDAHHLRLFVSVLTDGAWLKPLHDAALIQLPEPEMPWPVVGLLDGLGKTDPDAVADVLRCLLKDVNKSDPSWRWGQRFELLRIASQIGAAGHDLVAAIMDRHPDDRGAIRALAVGVVKTADPTASVVDRVADRVLSAGPHDRDRYYYTAVLEQLTAGMTEVNAAERIRLLTIKVRKLAEHSEMKFIVLDNARLTSSLGDNHDFVSILTHYFAAALTRCRALGVATSELRRSTDTIPGEIGERVTSRVLADADDVPVQDQIKHIAARLASSSITGDDKDLVDAILARAPDPALLTAWRDALGDPPTSPEPASGRMPRAWARVWSWSAALPDSVLIGWQPAIKQVAEKYGPPNAAEFDTRISSSGFLVERSAYSTDQLAELPVLEAAQLVAQWRPDNARDSQMHGARELARTLEVTVKNAITAWIQDPAEIAAALREPLYVLHYFYALTAKASDAAPQTPSILDAAHRVRTARQTPTILGHDAFDYELDWSNVDHASIELAQALANAGGDLSAHLDTAWAWARESVDLTPDSTETEPSTADTNTVRQAMSTASGRALLAIIAFAAWEHPRIETVRADFPLLLDEVLTVDGTRGAEYRAALAIRRPVLETLVPDWLTTNAMILFGNNAAGSATFDITLQHARPTPWLRSTLRERLVSAANSGSEPAITSLLGAVLDHSPDYTIDTVLAALQGNTANLSTANETMAFLVQPCDPDDPRLQLASDFWRALIAADRKTVPAEVLSSSGRWAFVTGLDDEVWSALTLQVLDTTAGRIDLVTEVADRCKSAAATQFASRILLLLLGQGEPWEQHYVAQAAIKALPTLVAHSDRSAHRLRTRLIDLGYHAAENIPPPPADGNTSND